MNEEELKILLDCLTNLFIECSEDEQQIIIDKISLLVDSLTYEDYIPNSYKPKIL